MLKLFDIIGLKPQAGACFTGRKPDELVHEEALKRMDQSKSKTTKEVVGDGEEIEVEDGENLNSNELDMIYRKQVDQSPSPVYPNDNGRAQRHDRSMSEMEPSSTFTLSLRGYQKQALL